MNWKKNLLNNNLLLDILHQQNLTPIDKILVCLAVDVLKPKKVREIKILAANGGLRGVLKWNVSAMLIRSRGRAVRTPEGWVLSTSGKNYISKIITPFIKKPTITKTSTSLRSHLDQISDPQIMEFVDQAIKCFEAEYYRAAVVLSWVGAVSVLYEHVRKHKLSAFNTEAKRRNQKWKQAKTRDDLARMKEKDFLDIIEGISVIGKSVKDALGNCLTLRNGCGHPNSLKIADNKVAAHIEDLILNVFSKFNA